jgi:transcriptional regulator with XRE-family HTH domain
VFAAQLRDLRMQYGKPTQQELADAMHCGRTMVSEILSGRRFPAWKHAWALVTTCARSDGKELEQRWRERWLRGSRKLDALRYGQVAPGQEPPDLPAVTDVESGQGGSSLEEAAASLIPAVWHRDNPGFYRAAAQYVRRARSEICLTYIRQYPPTDFTTPEPAEYFGAQLRSKPHAVARGRRWSQCGVY